MKKVTIFTAVIFLFIGVGGGIAVSKYLLKPAPKEAAVTPQQSTEDTEMLAFQKTMQTLRQKSGSEFDKEFLTKMMDNSQNAIEMASLAGEKSEKEEIKKFSEYIGKTEPTDINQLKGWYNDWGFLKEDQENNPHVH